MRRVVLAKAQSISEFLIVLGVVAVIFSAMQVYVRRGLQARLKQASDFLVATAKSRLTVDELRKLNQPQWNIVDVNTGEIFYRSPVYNEIVFEPEDYPTFENKKEVETSSSIHKGMAKGGSSYEIVGTPLQGESEGAIPGEVINQKSRKTIYYPY